MSDAPDLERHLFALEQRLMRPGVRASRKEVEELLDPEFVEFGSSGKIHDRASVVTALLLEAPAAWSIADFRARRLAEDVALVTYLAIMAGGGSSLRCSLWKRSAGAWKMTFHQGTPA